MLEIKILFKSGYIGYFTPINEDDPTEESIFRLRELISTAKKQLMRGSFELKELKTDYITVIDVQEIVTFGTRLVEKSNELILNKPKCVNKKVSKKKKT
ncbi:hypothetical protein [Clostridium chromiireducens]|uniref:Uncharacterized protein n=1 Tax=Clostridium chromiireducens TaxID=225345 RepID=A0A1V4IDC9_9CLOT|nr:hypothetical protein [Clostridium chromiireducens]OPJ57971.1 hypothetical protein CLCHR_41580 [Clostridium chromiireducens]